MSYIKKLKKKEKDGKSCFLKLFFRGSEIYVLEEKTESKFYDNFADFFLKETILIQLRGSRLMTILEVLQGSMQRKSLTLFFF